MRNKIPAVIFCSLLLSFIFLSASPLAFAQSVSRQRQIPPQAATVAVTATPEPAAAPKEPSPFKLVYIAEYDGNKIGSSFTTSPTGDSYGILHDFRAGYALTKSNVIGVREQVMQNFNTSDTSPNTFVMSDWRIYVTWSKMMRTSDVEIDGTLDTVFPTSNASKNAGKILKFNIKNVWTLKTALRNWSFQLLTIVSPAFFQDPTAATDFSLFAIPMITVDIAPQIHGYFELDLDAAHKYAANFLDFTQGSPDTFSIGPQIDLNSHVTIFPALKFYVGNLSFSAATLYFNLTAAL